MADIIDVNIGDQVLEVYWQDEVELNLDMNLMYIKSGQKEIQDYVDNVSKPEIDNYIETQAKPIVAEVVTQIAEPTVNEYLETVTKPSINEYVDGLKPDLQTYVDQAQENANSAATSMEQAALSATAASNYASNASADADNAAESAGLAANSAAAAKVSEANAKASETNAAATKAEVEAIAELASFGNIGDIKYTSRTDVPNGGAWCDGTLYTKAQFPDVYQMLVDGKLQSTTVSAFDSSVSANGSCGFFGLDTANERFKVPLLKDVYLKAGQAGEMFGAESLPNITGKLSISGGGGYGLEGAFFSFASDKNNIDKLNWSSGQGNIENVRFSAYNSSSTYQDGAKVNPDHVTYRAYVVLYASAAEASVAQVAEFMTALNSKQDIATAVNYTNITNCITEIPQDIKLELKDGVLTLKAGSKLYKGNSTFIVTEEDKSITGTNASAISFYDIENNSLEWRLLSECYSQDTAPTNTKYMLWLDTANKTVKCTKDTGATWHECSLPVCIFTAGSTQIISIDQVFNGFGYIGSTIFALPGVKGLIPNGRNADGSLRNIEFTTSSVITHTRTDWDSYTRIFHLRDDYKILSLISANAVYDSVKNIVYNKTSPTDNIGCVCGEVVTVDGRITSFTPKTAFHAVDRNDIVKGSDITTSNDYTIPSTANVDNRIVDIMNNNYATKIKDSGAGGVQLTASNGLMFQLLATRITSGKTWTYGKAFKKTVRVVGCRAAGGKYEHGAVLGTPTLTNVYVDCRGYDNGFMSTSIDVLAFGW